MATLENQNIHHVNSSDHLKELLSKDLERISLLYFWAPWAEPCKQMTEVVTELSRKYPKLLSLQIEAEAQEDITQSFDIESVPSFIILRVRSTHVSLWGAYHSKLLHQRRAILYSGALPAQTPAPSPNPLQSTWAHLTPRPLPNRTSLLLLHRLWRPPKSSRSVYVVSWASLRWSFS
jgi:thiol-disulfide isomerase/thioredoxin